MKVVIFKINKLGDNVAFVSSIQSLRQRFPEWKLTLITTPDAAELYRGPLGPQEVLVTPKTKFDKSFRRPWVLLSWVRRIRKIQPDACILGFDQGMVAHVVARLSGARIRVGGQSGRISAERFLTERIPLPDDESPLTWSWRIAGALALQAGADNWPQSPSKPDLTQLLPRGPKDTGPRKRIVVQSGAGGVLNQWGEERFAAVATALSRDFEVIWIRHGPNSSPVPAGAIDAPVTSLSEYSAWVASAQLFLGNNSGPMHVANALGCPGVVVTGPSAFGWDPFWWKERWTILRHPGLYCAPCEKLKETLTRCINLANPMACMGYWTDEKVEEACRSRLN